MSGLNNVRKVRERIESAFFMLIINTIVSIGTLVGVIGFIVYKVYCMK